MRAENQQSAEALALTFSMTQHRRPCQIWPLSASSFRDGQKDQPSDVHLHIGESRDSGFALRAPRNDICTKTKEARYRGPLSLTLQFFNRAGGADDVYGSIRHGHTVPTPMPPHRPPPHTSIPPAHHLRT